MLIPENRLRYLFERWVQQDATLAEQDELHALLAQHDADDALSPLMKEAWERLQVKETLNTEAKDAMVNNILRRGEPAKVRSMRRYWWAAAAVAVVLAGALGYQLNQPPPVKPVVQASTTHDVAPGRQGAILTLANGQTIVLDSLNNGVIANQQGTQVSLSNGQVSYDAAAANEVVYNTMTTPRGRQFQLVLPDGSLVWLNAASSLRFPTVFSGEQRLVEVSGEVYFEVARDAKRPFIVTVNNTQVEVTGTSFNINAYEDETAITTTLLTGGVNVRSGGAVKVLRPGQQASVAGNNISLKNDADMDAAVAWKNGMISFQGATLPEVMRKLARWYDLKVIYEGKIPETIFDGELPNTLQLSQVTKILTKVEIKFRIEEGNKLIVLAD